MSLKPPPANWEDAIRDAAIQFMNGTVCFYEEIVAVPYDPITGNGGEVGVDILWSGKARIQQIRSPRQFDTEYQADASRYFRFQLDPEDNPPQIPFGTKARVLDGGRDADLQSLIYVTNSAINSSHMAVRTVELVSNMDFVTWEWNPAIPARPYGLAADAITDSGFTLTWSAPPGDPAAVEYQTELNGTANPVAVTVTNRVFTGLLPETTYTVRVRARATGTAPWSHWSLPKTIETAE